MRIKMSEMIAFGLFIILAVIAYQYSDEAARAWAERRQQPSIVYVAPTPQAVPVQIVQPQPVPVVIAEPAIDYQPTVDAYYQSQAEQPARQLERGGWEAATPEGSTGVHDPGRSDKRSTAAP
jgi:hypothetical protein